MPEPEPPCRLTLKCWSSSSPHPRFEPGPPGWMPGWPSRGRESWRAVRGLKVMNSFLLLHVPVVSAPQAPIRPEADLVGADRRRLLAAATLLVGLGRQGGGRREYGLHRGRAPRFSARHPLAR